MMALSRLLALLSLVAALLLLAQALPFRHGSSRQRGGGPVLADILLAALDRLQGVDVVGLATRRNMVLLCHAILLVLLGDAGILGVPARRRRRALAEPTTRSACYSPPPRAEAERSHGRTRSSAVVVWRARDRSSPVDVGRLGERRQPRPREPESAAEHQEIVLVEEQQEETSGSLDARRLVALEGELDRPAAAVDDGETSSISVDSLSLAVVAHQAENNDGAEEEAAAGGGGPAASYEYRGEEEDLDEMNRQFEAFIAVTKEKMRLEALQDHQQPAHFSSSRQNRALLAR